MKIDIIIPTLYVLTGISAYSGISHLFIGLRRPFNRLHLLFAAMCFSVVAFGSFHALALQAPAIPELLTALRFNLAGIIFFYLFFPWFIAEYSGIRPLPVLIAFNILALILLLANLAEPNTIQYQDIQAIYRLRLPWGEEVTRVIGINSNWFKLAVFTTLALFAFAFYALATLYRRGHKRTALIMLGAMGLFILAAIQGILVRMSIIHFAELGPFGYMALILVMSMVLSYETRQNGLRMQAILDYVPSVVYIKDLKGRYQMINRHYEKLFRLSNQQTIGKTDYDIFPQAQADQLRANDQQVLTSKNFIETEEIVEQDGSPHTYFSIKFPLLNFDGSAALLCGISTDITERKRAEAELVNSELKHRILFENANDAIFIMRENQFIDCNEKALLMFGCSRVDVMGKTPMAFSPLQQNDGQDSGIKALSLIHAAYCGEAQTFEWQHIRQNGELFDVDVSLNVCDLQGKRCLLAIVRDITEKKRVESAIRQISAGVTSTTGKDFFQKLVQSLARLFAVDYAFVGVLDEHQTDQVDTLAVYSHGQIVDNFSYSIRGTPCAIVMGNETCAYPQDVQKLFPEDILLAEMGVEGYIATPLFDAKATPLGLIVLLDSKPLQHTGQLKDIMEIFAARTGAELERMRADDQIRRMAYQDYLTELPNRALLHERLAEVLAHARRSDAYAALLLIDLDHFKTINDALGHDVGDEVLRSVGHRLAKTVAQRAFIARIGGDEFVALVDIPASQHQEMEALTQELSQEILESMSSPMMIGDRLLSVGASIGAVLFPSNGETALDILRHADMALYRAKDMGRNNMQSYTPGLQSGADVRLALEDGLRNAIANNELELNFQPLVNAAGKMIGAEALIRWHHPELGTISPATFIPVAEETGLIHSIGHWVFDQACNKFTGWLNAGIPFEGYLSINVCPWQFARPDFVQQIRHILAERTIDPSRLMLELTESALLYDIKETIGKLTELRSIGLRVALDDFGTGYSSLAYLKDLPLDLLKIDIAFIRELNTNQEQPLVETIISIGRHMKLAVIAEGVETEMQRDILLQMGCERFQGFLYSKPLPEEDFVAWMKINKTQT